MIAIKNASSPQKCEMSPTSGVRLGRGLLEWKTRGRGEDNVPLIIKKLLVEPLGHVFVFSEAVSQHFHHRSGASAFAPISIWTGSLQTPSVCWDASPACPQRLIISFPPLPLSARRPRPLPLQKSK